MVIILCVCSQKMGKLQTLTAQTSYWQTSNYTRNNKRLLPKPFRYKFMTIYITHAEEIMPEKLEIILFFCAFKNSNYSFKNSLIILKLCWKKDKKTYMYTELN